MANPNDIRIEPSSFRDPSGFVFYREGRLYRQINASYQSQYEHLVQSGLYEALVRLLEKTALRDVKTEWGDYYVHTNYSDEAAGQKESIVASMLDEIAPKTLWDFGANDGRYSRLASQRGIGVIAFDIDPIATERNYAMVKAENDNNMLPLILDLTNPSPDIGFANRERVRVQSRQTPDAILMLAVVHHLAISNNVPLGKLAEWLSALARHLIIEFVPKEDSQVKVLLATRADVFPDYHTAGFEAAFGQYFNTQAKRQIEGTERTLYLMKAKA